MHFLSMISKVWMIKKLLLSAYVVQPQCSEVVPSIGHKTNRLSDNLDQNHKDSAFRKKKTVSINVKTRMINY